MKMTCDEFYRKFEGVNAHQKFSINTHGTAVGVYYGTALPVAFGTMGDVNDSASIQLLATIDGWMGSSENVAAILQRNAAGPYVLLSANSDSQYAQDVVDAKKKDGMIYIEGICHCLSS